MSNRNASLSIRYLLNQLSVSAMKYPQRSLIARVEREIKKHSLISAGDTIIVALSGGPDSVCLFDILYKLNGKLSFKLIACHFNHKMRGKASNQDEKFVKEFCAKRGVECLIGTVEQGIALKSEESAREARYSFFEKILKQGRGAKVALAHNSNDLSETFILRLIRGAGLRGLRSIPRSRKNFIRPLLDFTRAEIETYLNENNIEYRIDKTNQNIKYARNFVRLKIVPLLARLNPNILSTIANAVVAIDDDYDFILKEAKKAFASILLHQEKNTIELSYHGWKLLHPALQRMVLRVALEEVADLIDITNIQLSEIIELLKKGVGRKYKVLPHSLRIALISGKIILVRDTN